MPPGLVLRSVHRLLLGTSFGTAWALCSVNSSQDPFLIKAIVWPDTGIRCMSTGRDPPDWVELLRALGNLTINMNVTNTSGTPTPVVVNSRPEPATAVASEPASSSGGGATVFWALAAPCYLGSLPCILSSLSAIYVFHLQCLYLVF